MGPARDAARRPQGRTARRTRGAARAEARRQGLPARHAPPDPLADRAAPTSRREVRPPPRLRVVAGVSRVAGWALHMDRRALRARARRVVLAGPALGASGRRVRLHSWRLAERRE